MQHYQVNQSQVNIREEIKRIKLRTCPFTVGAAVFTVGEAQFTVGGAVFTVGGAVFTVGGACLQ